ncbi:DUF2207 family protein [Luedemannella helvata]|uniref:Predicted membrane protein YciQ-like C-terminal domain-containing protein n=1 Tax=Luedemannella helvata TaxID=349315 RepID=A0ABN2KPE9_9ACTN
MDIHYLDIAVAAGAVAAWFAAYAVALLVTRPASVTPAPASQDLPPEPPALASLLANRWELTEDAAEATLLDLGARRVLEFRQPGNDIMQTTIHVRDPQPAGLTVYEHMVFHRVASLAKGGMLPLTALTFRNERQSESWWKRLRAEIIADARKRGLSRRRLSKGLVTALNLLAVGAVLPTVVAVYRHAEPGSGDSPVGAAIGAAIVVFGLLSYVVGRNHGERDTPAGRESASRWLGVKAWLRGHESFADLPPASVAVWDRYLAYGAAVGATRATSAAIEMGMGDHKLVWSHFGGVWHRVRIRYPRAWWRYGRTAPQIIIRALVVGAIGMALLWKLSGFVAEIGADQTGAVAKAFGLGSTIMLVLGVVGVTYGAYMLVRAVIDLAAPVTITGEALWLRVWKQHPGGENSPPKPWLHYLALDDGKADRTRAWALPTQFSYRVDPGDTVTIVVRPWSRRVGELTVVEPGHGARTQVAPADDNTEALIAQAMGVVPAQRPATGGAGMVSSIIGAMAAGGAPVVDLPEIEQLVPVADVSRAVGAPCAYKALPPVPLMPMRTGEFTGPDGGTVLQVVVGAGPLAAAAGKGRDRGTPLPGIGDEAYALRGVAVARQGDIMVSLKLDGPAEGTDPRNLYWLLAQVVGRLPGKHPTGTPGAVLTEP